MILSFTYSVSANSFHRNYSFFNLALCTVTFVTAHKSVETIRGNTVYQIASFDRCITQFCVLL